MSQQKGAESVRKRVRVKICGLTRIEDVQAAVAAGADAIGFVFYGPSPRAVEIAQVETLMTAVPPFVTTVGLFVNPVASRVWEVLDSVPLDLLQFHGDESAGFCAQFQRPYIKAIRLGGPQTTEASDLERLVNDHSAARGFLLDSYDPNQFGGTGETFDWSICTKLRGENREPILVLAGGLNAENVSQAIEQVEPFAVDVSSGVEGSKKGEKEAELIEAFMQAVQSSSLPVSQESDAQKSDAPKPDQIAEKITDDEPNQLEGS